MLLLIAISEQFCGTHTGKSAADIQACFYAYAAFKLTRISVTPVERQLFQLSSTFDLQHGCLSGLQAFKHRSELLDRIDCLLVQAVHDIAYPQARRCTNSALVTAPLQRLLKECG
jgi:hypothetical protein